MNVDELRKEFPITENLLYFNTGWSGPLPTPVVDAMANTLRRGASIGPASQLFLSEISKETAGLRNDLGTLMGTRAEEIALTHSTGDGLNTVYAGMDWHRGDKVVTTNLEHVANMLPLMQLRRRYGVETVSVEADSDGLFDAEEFEKVVDEKTRLVTVSHVTYMLGTILPIKEITEIAHERNVPVLLDMAQSVGCVRFNLKELGCDFGAARGGKWLLGPGGTGFFYVNSDRLQDLTLSSIGYEGAKITGDDYSYHPGARRFEISEPNAALRVGLRRAVRYHTDIGRETVEKRVRSLAGYLIEEAGRLPNLEVLGTHDLSLKNGLVSIVVKGHDATKLVPTLEQKHGIVTRAVQKFNAVRVSLHIFNTEEEIETLVDILRSI